MGTNGWKPSTRVREPAELLKPVVDPAAWYPADVEDGDAWVYRLSSEEIAEVEKGVASVERQGLELIDVTARNFPLDRLAEGLWDIRAELMEGRGFALVRGLPIEGRSRAWIATAFWGIGRHIGSPISQNGRGHLLGHVTDLGADYRNQRGYMSRAAMAFHTDRADVLSLCCLHPAKSGGQHRIASAITVYNEMLKRRPDLVGELLFPFYRSRSGEIPPGESSPWTRGGFFSVTDGYFTAHGSNAGVRKAQSIPGVPPLTAAQEEALRMYRDLASEFRLDIDLRIGDITYVQNYVTVHSRTDFEDWPEPERKRHLLRLWLNNGMRPLAEEVKREVRGVVVPGTVLQASIEAS